MPVWRLRRKASLKATTTLYLDPSTDWGALSHFASDEPVRQPSKRAGAATAGKRAFQRAAMNEQLATLSELLHDDHLLLIVRGNNKLTKA
ncbi:hypothetical protein KCP71_24130 [Salmonella enterica subsp. enterica]|nr:hypothetical protein KCP71_24130 [Salmonella enterica subsp. enterica]